MGSATRPSGPTRACTTSRAPSTGSGCGRRATPRPRPPIPPGRWSARRISAAWWTTRRCSAPVSCTWTAGWWRAWSRRPAGIRAWPTAPRCRPRPWPRPSRASRPRDTRATTRSRGVWTGPRYRPCRAAPSAPWSPRSTPTATRWAGSSCRRWRCRSPPTPAGTSAIPTSAAPSSCSCSRAAPSRSPAPAPSARPRGTRVPPSRSGTRRARPIWSGSAPPRSRWRGRATCWKKTSRSRSRRARASGTTSPADRSETPMYDLLLKGGTVLDPAGGLDGALDVAVANGVIARVAAGIPETEATRTLDVRGKIVTPGLIDLHAHVFEGFNRTGVNPDLGGVYAGVTTIVDAGSAGAAPFGGFPRHILPHCHTEVIPFLHICSTGLATLPDIIAESSVNLDDTLKVVAQHKGLIRGIKARMVSPALEIMGMEMPRLAKRAARESGVKLMVHIGDTEKRYDPNVIRSLLPLLEPGDILTHYFTPNPGGVLDGNGKLVPEVREAADRGVWFDTAHGRMNFSFDVGRRV